MASLDKQIADLRAEILKRRAEVLQLEEAARLKAVDDPEGAVTSDSRAAAVRRLLPRLLAAYRATVARKVVEDIEASKVALDAEMERELLAKTAGFPSLVEALNAVVPSLNALNKHPLFSRLAYGRDFLSNKLWAPFLKGLPLIFEEWQKEDRAAAERDLWTKKEQAKRQCEEEGRRLIADLAEEEEPAVAGVTS